MVSEQDKKQVARTLERFRSQLEGTAERHRPVIQQILWWTERQPFLTQTVCDLILQFTPAIPAGEEVETVNMLVQTRLIQNWETQAAAKHLNEIRDAILRSDRRAKLLKLYRQILQSGRATANDSPEQQELLKSGLVALGEGQLWVSNRIYQEVFNLGWVNGELAKLDRSSAPELDRSSALETDESEESTPGPLSKLASGAALLMFLAGAVFYLLQPETPPPPLLPEACGNLSGIARREHIEKLENLKEKMGEEFPSPCQDKLDELQYDNPMSELPPACVRLPGSTRPEHIEKLENIKTEMGEKFPSPCQDKLDELRYDYAIDILASRNGELIEAGKTLCKVTETYYKNNEPSKQYFRNWSENSDDFRNWLEGLDTPCPAKNYLE